MSDNSHEVATAEPGHGEANAHLPQAAVASQAFVALADNVRDYAIFLMDPDGVITFWGEGARLMKWWRRDEAEGSHLRLLYPKGGSNDGTADAHLQFAAEHGEYTGEGERVRSDGSTFWAGITLTALRDGDGDLLGFAKVTRDLTARRAADALLQSAAASAESARAEAEAASLAKTGFLATMSHEIRTPINAVMGYLELLNIGLDGPLTRGQRQHVSRAAASARHLLELVSGVLDFSQVEADRAGVDFAAFRVGDVVTSAIESILPQAHERGLELTEAGGGYASNLAVMGDERRARQIVINLLTNAVKFTERRDGDPGRIMVSVGTAEKASPEARVTGRGPWVYIRVEDTGVGIPDEHLEPVFDPFVQGDMTLTRPLGGIGLGLAISRRLARLMGGDVTVRSVVGVGSSFFLWLPAAPLESFATGGLRGHGPGGEGEVVEAEDVQSEHAEELEGRKFTRRSPGTFGIVADAVLAELEHVLRAYVDRLGVDAATPSAHGVDGAQVEDHLATFIGDLASTLRHLDGPGGTVSAPTRALLDSSALQRHISERHGASRARLGWLESELHREFAVLEEELTAAVRRQVASGARGRNTPERQAEIDRALEVLRTFLRLAKEGSVNSWRRSREH